MTSHEAALKECVAALEQALNSRARDYVEVKSPGWYDRTVDVVTRAKSALSSESEMVRLPDGRVDIAAMNAANCPDVAHGGREEDCQDNDEGA